MTSATRWHTIRAIDPRTLTEDRLQVHYGAWILASVAHAVLPHRPDEGHATLGIADAGARLVTHVLAPERQANFDLVLEPLELQLREGERRQAVLQLPGTTIEASVAWARTALPELVPDAPRLQLQDEHGLPDHPLKRGIAFADGDPQRRAALGEWLSFAERVLERVLADVPGSSPLRVWPQRFELRSSVVRDAAGGRQIRVAFSPGAPSLDEPFFRVTPLPATDALPELHGPGRWHEDVERSLVLPATELLAAGADLDAIATDFVRRAFDLCRELTG